MRTRRASPRDNHHAWGSGRDDSLSAWTFAGDRALRQRQGGDHRRVPPGAVRLRPACRGNATHQRTRAASADVRGGSSRVSSGGGAVRASERARERTHSTARVASARGARARLSAVCATVGQGSHSGGGARRAVRSRRVRRRVVSRGRIVFPARAAHGSSDAPVSKSWDAP